MYKVVFTNEEEYEQFKKIAKIQMIQQKISVKEMSKRTGYSVSSIHNFFCSSGSRMVAWAIGKELGIFKDEEPKKKGKKR